MPYIINSLAWDEISEGEDRKISEGEDRKTKESRDNRKSAVHVRRLPSVKKYRSIWDLRDIEETKMEANEERLIFIKALRSAYHYLIEKGEVDR